MTTKELIQAQIETIPEEDLDDLYQLIRGFVESKATPNKPGLMSRLKTVKIEAPPDFAANLDLYLSGEKRVEEDVR